MAHDYITMKVFDLSKAPPEARDSEDLADLRRNSAEGESTILHLKVGFFDTPHSQNAGAEHSREVTYAEFTLHSWLMESGASRGEEILLRWDSSFPPQV